MVVLDRNKNIDVLFINEGTYPMVRGGVAGWISQLILGNPDINFGVIFIGSSEDDYEGIRYDLPENLVFLDINYLFEESNLPKSKELQGSDEVYKLKHFLSVKKNIPEELKTLQFYTEKVTLEKFLYGRKTWYFLEDIYLENNLELPFIEFFWTVRNLFLPLWKVASIAEGFVRRKKSPRLIHSPSTGYAGFMSSLLKKELNVPFLLTEHGIYVKERKIDILNSDIFRSKDIFSTNPFGIDPLKVLWINFFINLGKISYGCADKITSLYEDARKVQISLGAPPEKTEVIPNGIKIEKFNVVLKMASPKPVVALIGRVVPIKDVKTFIKAVKLLNTKIDVKGWVVGPTDEDPEYYQECLNLVEILGLEGNLEFLGFQNVVDVLKEVGVSTLTSISEGMPLVVLESLAGGIPFVATDVGACRQLIYGGLDEEDVKLGKAGIVVPVASPFETARAYERLLTDRAFWTSCSRVGRKRVEYYYSFDKFLLNYKRLYSSLMGTEWQEYPLN
jgi:glycosyltransferase involved in cell wall biosynthesis